MRSKDIDFDVIFAVISRKTTKKNRNTTQATKGK